MYCQCFVNIQITIQESFIILNVSKQIVNTVRTGSIFLTHIMTEVSRLLRQQKYLVVGTLNGKRLIEQTLEGGSVLKIVLDIQYDTKCIQMYDEDNIFFTYHIFVSNDKFIRQRVKTLRPGGEHIGSHFIHLYKYSEFRLTWTRWEQTHLTT